jgi:uncharacterized protein
MMLTWQGLDVPRLEGVRLVLSERGMRATGAMVCPSAGDRPAFAATYSLATSETGVVSRVSVRSVALDGERQVTLNRSEEGIWLVDHGQGAKRTDFNGAVDVDVAKCVLFNALPVRRLGLHNQPGDHDLPMVYVRLPDLSVELVRQGYRSRPMAAGPPTVTFTAGDFTADLTVDDEGIVVDYPGLAKRI